MSIGLEVISVLHTFFRKALKSRFGDLLKLGDSS